jgi:hypothetical protein
MSPARVALILVPCALTFLAAVSGSGCGGGSTGGGGTGGAGSSSSTTASTTSNSTASTTSSTTSSSTTGSGGTGGTGGGMMVCMPGTTQPCYDGPAATKGVGICHDGQQTCLADGSGYGACAGQTLPLPAEDCTTPGDDDCDGHVNDVAAGCICTPAATAPCYEGPAATQNVGLCHDGTKTCAADGKSFGACAGQVLPQPETCNTPGDDDCNGQTNEGGAGCGCTPNSTIPCYSGPPNTMGVGPCVGGVQVCNTAGTGYGPCTGEVLPQPETCNTPIDDNCNGQTNEGGAGCVCTPNASVSCYTGPAGTQGVGICKAGTALCNDQGTVLGTCMGQVLPATETCNNAFDDNCNGQTNEGGAGCVCLPNSVASCYSGPANTQNVGICHAGTKTCNGLGTAYGACAGEVLPAATDSCSNTLDDNCSGQVNEGCPTSYAVNVQPIYAAHCATCHTIGGSGGFNFATVYADSQAMSFVCPGLTVGACTLKRIQNGSMPQGAGCTGNPTTDAGNPACLTAAEQATIQAWISAGQLP